MNLICCYRRYLCREATARRSSSLFYTVFSLKKKNLYLTSIWGPCTLNGFLCFSFVFLFTVMHIWCLHASSQKEMGSIHINTLLPEGKGMLVLLSGVYYLIAWKIARGKRHCPVWYLSNIYHYVLKVHLLLDSLQILIQWILS